MSLGAAPVEVLAQQNVNGTAITTVSASDTDSLKAWMTTNGFTWTDDMAVWLDPYIKKSCVITLFKYEKQGSGPSTVSSSLLDLTFRTTVPFFPYSEPASQRLLGNYAPHRSLTIYLFSDSRMYGQLEANPDKVKWSARLLYADRVKGGKLIRLLPLLNLHSWDIPANSWLTVMQDTATPRPGVADVLFGVSNQQSTVSVANLQDRIGSP
jgi:hypothetical protein